MEEKYYKHKYGGIYQFIREEIYDNKQMTIYKHIYPFEENFMQKLTKEFKENFKEISQEQLNQELTKPRDEFQLEITGNRTKQKT